MGHPKIDASVNSLFSWFDEHIQVLNIIIMLYWINKKLNFCYMNNIFRITKNDTKLNVQ